MDPEILYENCAPFRGMGKEEIAQARSAMREQVRSFEKGEVVLLAGVRGAKMGLVLMGSVTVEKSDFLGNRSILSHIGPGEVFAETYACLPDAEVLVDVTANEDCRVAFFEVAPSLRQPERPQKERWAQIFFRNLLMISMRKNLQLSARNFHTSPKSARGRIASYLETMAVRTQSREFTIPFDRQQMADYLNLDRTALSKELGRMKREGLIDFHKNRFRLAGGQEELR